MLEEMEWLSDEEEEELNKLSVQPTSTNAQEVTPKISLHVVTGALNPKTMRLLG